MGQSAKNAVSIRSLDFAFESGKPVFKNLNLELSGGGVCGGSPAVILGPSGCGKTTLLKLIAGLLEPASGQILAGPVSMVFQEPRLLPWKTALENVCLPITEKLGKKRALEAARHFLSLVSLSDKEGALPKELSGGQQQRVNLARAFACETGILLMDEPFQSLDIPLRIKLMDLSLSLLASYPRLAVVVSHDPREAVYLANRILVFAPGGGVVFDEAVGLEAGQRVYGHAAAGEIEMRLFEKLSLGL